MNKLKQTLEKVLKQEEVFLDAETEELNYIKIKDLADKFDEKLIGRLAENEDLKSKFFTKIKDVHVFKINDFKFFLDENKIDNSYTQYANRIGLSDGNGLLENRSEVVLDFPFKDCILEGGQSTEEGQDTYFEYKEEKEAEEKKAAGYKEGKADRKEVFFNQILAHDEIDRLFEKKALVNWKRFTKDSGKNGTAIEEIARDDGTIKENLIIKGNNLLALHSLKSEFAGKVKLIYIDPPYNTGSDSFGYNDNFGHSTWLTFMKNRLEIARDLLRDDGVIFVQCDDNEQAYLKVLMDEIFKRKNFVNNLVWHKKNVVQNDATYFNENHDHILVFCMDKDNWKPRLLKRTAEMDARYKNPDKDPKGLWTSVALQAKSGTKESIYEMEFPNGVKWKPVDGTYPRMSKESLQEAYKEDRLWFGKAGTNVPRLKKYLNEVQQGLVASTIFANDDSGSTQQGKEELKNVLQKNVFTTPKPEKLLEKIVHIATQKGDIVLDYHLGSGTTAAVAHKMGRQYIGVEQMDHVETIAIERLVEVVGGERGGISESRNWEGGGDFIYMELAKWNERAKEKIGEAENLSGLIELFDTLCEKYFLDYNIKIKEFKDKIVKEDNFKKLTLPEQKLMFLTMLDLNQMYVQVSEVSDERYGISPEDQRLTKRFYEN